MLVARLLHSTVYEKSQIQPTSVGLARDRPNKRMPMPKGSRWENPQVNIRTVKGKLTIC